MAKASFLKLIFAGSLVFVLAGCSSSIRNQVKMVETFFSWYKIGTSSDYLLVKQGIAGRDPVAVVFGFMDDSEFCNEIAELYMKKYNLSRYHCEKLN